MRFDVHAVWQQTPHLPLRVRIAVDTLASRLPSIMSLDRPAPLAALNARPEYGGVRRLNIDVCRFEGVLFDKGATRFNGVPHQGREQLVSGNRVLTVTRSMRRLSGSMVVSHS